MNLILPPTGVFTPKCDVNVRTGLELFGSWHTPSHILGCADVLVDLFFVSGLWFGPSEW